LHGMDDSRSGHLWVFLLSDPAIQRRDSSQSGLNLD
jgi:hypothetical protein